MAEGGLPRAQEAERDEMARIREEKRAHEERQYLAFEQVRHKLNLSLMYCLYLSIPFACVTFRDEFIALDVGTALTMNNPGQ